MLEAWFKTQEKKISSRVILCYDSTDEDKNDFYNQLESVTEAGSNTKNITIVLGDLDAKIGPKNECLQEIMGKHGK